MKKNDTQFIIECFILVKRFIVGVLMALFTYIFLSISSYHDLVSIIWIIFITVFMIFNFITNDTKFVFKNILKNLKIFLYNIRKNWKIFILFSILILIYCFLLNNIYYTYYPLEVAFFELPVLEKIYSVIHRMFFIYPILRFSLSIVNSIIKREQAIEVLFSACGSITLSGFIFCISMAEIVACWQPHIYVLNTFYSIIPVMISKIISIILEFLNLHSISSKIKNIISISKTKAICVSTRISISKTIDNVNSIRDYSNINGIRKHNNIYELLFNKLYTQKYDVNINSITSKSERAKISLRYSKFHLSNEKSSLTILENTTIKIRVYSLFNQLEKDLNLQKLKAIENQNHINKIKADKLKPYNGFLDSNLHSNLLETNHSNILVYMMPRINYDNPILNAQVNTSGQANLGNREDRAQALIPAIANTAGTVVIPGNAPAQIPANIPVQNPGPSTYSLGTITQMIGVTSSEDAYSIEDHNISEYNISISSPDFSRLTSFRSHYIDQSILYHQEWIDNNVLTLIEHLNKPNHSWTLGMEHRLLALESHINLKLEKMIEKLSLSNAKTPVRIITNPIDLEYIMCRTKVDGSVTTIPSNFLSRISPLRYITNESLVRDLINWSDSMLTRVGVVNTEQLMQNPEYHKKRELEASFYHLIKWTSNYFTARNFINNQRILAHLDQLCREEPSLQNSLTNNLNLHYKIAAKIKRLNSRFIYIKN